MNLLFCACGVKLGWLIFDIVQQKTMSMQVRSKGDLVIVETPAAEFLKQK
jgi:hypothetical protein